MRRLAALLLVLAALFPGEVLALEVVDPPWPPPGTASDLPACRVADEPTPLATMGDWRRTLLDTEYRLPSSYAPKLTSASAAGWTSAEGGATRIRALPELISALRAMRKDARAAGVRLAITSGYRSAALQATLFNAAVRTAGRAAALKAVARPGHSEHQLGTTLDMKTQGGPAPWTIAWEKTKEGRWLARNAARYGFVLSYPAGATARTCYKFESWHIRYLGTELAARVAASGATLRETLWAEQPR